MSFSECSALEVAVPQSLTILSRRQVELGQKEWSQQREERRYIEAQKSCGRPQQQAQVLARRGQDSIAALCVKVDGTW